MKWLICKLFHTGKYATISIARYKRQLLEIRCSQCDRLLHTRVNTVDILGDSFDKIIIDEITPI